MDTLGIATTCRTSQIAPWTNCSRSPTPRHRVHSNCRALLDGSNQRHLRDQSIKEIARRAGHGLNLVRNFIKTGLNRNDPTTALRSTTP